MHSGHNGDDPGAWIGDRAAVVVPMNDLLCRGALVGALVIVLWLCYRWRIKDIALTKEYDPEYFDRSNPRDRHERKCIEHQRTTGRELGPELRWMDED